MRPNLSSSNTNLVDNSLPVDDRRRAHRDQSLGHNDRHRERPGLILLPMYEVVRPRRSRHRHHRLSADVESLSHRHLDLELPVPPSGRLLSNPNVESISEEPTDRPLIFTGPQNWNPTQSASSSNIPQVVSLRSENADVEPRFSRPTLRINSMHASRPLHLAMSSSRLQPHHHRMGLESVLESRSQAESDVSANVATPMASTNRRIRVTTGQQTSPIPNQPTDANSVINSGQMDREIRVVRNARLITANNINNTNDNRSGNNSDYQTANESNRNLLGPTVENQSISTSISDASSIEDLNAGEILTSNRHSVVLSATTLSDSNNTPVMTHHDNEQKNDSGDWRVSFG